MNNFNNEIESLTEQNSLLKQRYEFYRARLNEISKRPKALTPVPPSSSKHNILQQALITSVQKLEFLKKEKESFTVHTKLYIKESLEDLENKKQQLEQKIQQIKLNRNSEKLHEATQDLSDEILQTRNKVEALESQHERNQKKIRDLEARIKESESFLKKSKAEDDEGGTETEKVYHRLCKIEKNLQASIKSNEAKYKQKLREYKAIEEKLAADKICLQMKILKTTQQERLLQLTIDQQGDGQLSNHNYANANFLYKPSIKGLYH